MVFAVDKTTEDIKAWHEQIDTVVRGFTVQSYLGPIRTPLSLELTDFFLDHPDFSALLVNLLKIAPYVSTVRGPNQFWANDGDGGTGLVTLVEQKSDKRIYFVEGILHSYYFPPIHAGAVVMMTIKPIPREKCDPAIESTFTIYVRLNNPVLAGLAKTVRPFIRNTVSQKFVKGFITANKIGKMMLENPDLVSRGIQALSVVPAGDRAVLLDLMSQLRHNQAVCQ